jgi:hypothetical protein
LNIQQSENQHVRARGPLRLFGLAYSGRADEFQTNFQAWKGIPSLDEMRAGSRQKAGAAYTKGIIDEQSENRREG